MQWATGLDSLRLAVGLTAIIRVLIVHAKAATMLMNAGFFSYIMFMANYGAWVRSMPPFYKDDVNADTTVDSYDELIKEGALHSH